MILTNPVLYTAIQIEDADRPRIGNDNAVKNTISNSLYGIHLINSGAEIYNTDFSDLITTSPSANNTNGTAIYISNSPLHWDRLLRVGRSQNSNTFKSCKNGIWGFGEVDYRIQFNIFGNDNASQTDDVLNTCINIEDAFYNEIEVGPENKFYDFDKGIFFYNLGENVTLEVKSNKFWDARWGNIFTRFHATAISLMNPIPIIFRTQAIIEENSIGTSASPNHSRIGISVVQAGNVNVFDNEIHFHYNSTTYPIFRGIQLINAQDCRINRNTTIRNSNYAQGLNSSVVGIYVQESGNPSINCNEPENMGFGMHFIGNNGAVTMVDNLLSTYDRGMSLGLNSNTPAFIGQIQGSQNPIPNGTGYLNTWDATSDERVEGFTMQPISWYHNGLAQYSNVNAPVNDNGNTMPGLTPRANANESNDCSTDSWIWNRTSGYAGLVYDTIRYEGEYSEQYHYGHRNSFYKFLSADTLRLEGSGSDTLYRHVFNQISATNIGKYQQVIHQSAKRNYLEANSLLETIEDTNSYETQLHTVLSLYLNRALNDSALSAQDTATLTEIADQNYLIGGEAVYLARAILRIEVEDVAMGEARLKNQMIENQSRYFKLHPNPASQWLHLDFNQEELVERIDITDLSGRVFQTTRSVKTIIISDMKPGLYFVTLYYSDGDRSTQKFIKIK